jgi:hypothetical protein
VRGARRESDNEFDWRPSADPRKDGGTDVVNANMVKIATAAAHVAIDHVFFTAGSGLH